MNRAAPANLAELVFSYAVTLPESVILTFLTAGENGRFDEERRTYPQLLGNAQALVRELNRLGTAPSDNIGLMMNNHPEFIETMVASAILGATFVPIDPRTMGAKLAYMLDFTESRGVVCADYCVGAILAVADECPLLEWLIVVPTGVVHHSPGSRLQLRKWPTIMEMAGEPLPITEQAPDDAMFMMFTSGTTGNPKAVIVSHSRYMALTQSPKMAGLTWRDKYYTGLSLTHINAQGTLAGALGQGIPAVISRKFTKSRLWDICRQYGCTTFNLLGGMIPEIYAIPEKPDDADNPVRYIQSSGMPATMWKNFEKRFGVVLAEGYGATEGGGLRNPPGVGPIGSIGKPAPGWIAEILDEHGHPCPPNTEGEICFRREDGAPVVVRYYKNAEAAAEKVRNGWLHMGDLGHKDEDGWFFFHHRVGGGVRRNGDFVNTALVETVIAQSPLVRDVFVYGVATKANVAGEKTLVAAVVATDPSLFDEAALLDYCREHLEKNDIPEIVQLLDNIPKTVSEKPIENACVELLRSCGRI